MVQQAQDIAQEESAPPPPTPVVTFEPADEGEDREDAGAVNGEGEPGPSAAAVTASGDDSSFEAEGFLLRKRLWEALDRKASNR